MIMIQKIQFLPNLIIKENKNGTTIKKGTALIIDLNEQIFNWAQIKEYPINIVSTNKDIPCKIIAKTKSKLEILFTRNLYPKEVVTIENLKLNSKGDFEEERLDIYFKTSHNDYSVKLDKNFSIKNIDFDIVLEKNDVVKKIDNNIIYSLRDKGINSINNYYPDLVFIEKSKFSTLNEKDTLIIEFPFELDMNYLKQSSTVKNLKEENYKLVNINDKKSYQIKLAIIDQVENNTIRLPEIKFKYPDNNKILDPQKIKFIKINETQKLLSDNYEYSKNDLTLTAGEPIIYLKENKELFKNNGREKLRN